MTLEEKFLDILNSEFPKHLLDKGVNMDFIEHKIKKWAWRFARIANENFDKKFFAFVEVTDRYEKQLASQVVIAEGDIIYSGSIGYMVGTSVFPSYGMSFNASEKLDEYINRGKKIKIILEVQEWISHQNT